MSQQPILQDGKLRFARVDSTGKEKEVDADLLELKLQLESCEEKHALQVKNGALVPTPAFLAEIATLLQGQGFEGCTSTQAWQTWVSVGKAMAVLKKNMLATPSLPAGITSTPSN